MKAARNYFDNAAAQYEERSAGALWRHIRAHEERAIVAAVDPHPGERILDAGSGAGHYSQLLKDAGAEVTALDFAPAMLERVRERLGIDTIQGDLATAQLEPRFDKVLCAGALEFVDNPAAAVANLTRAFDPESTRRLVLFLPRLCLGARLYRRFHRSHGVNVRLFSEADVLDLERAQGGFSIATRRNVLFNQLIVIQGAPR